MTALALYLHWPFCKAKCPYCDFNSHVRHGGVDERSFLPAFFKELAWVQERVGKAHITSIFFGGGTPSLLSSGAVGALLNEISRLWPLSSSCEITLEANPTSVEAHRFEGYRAAGVNRISLGIQSLKDESLQALGRQHTAEEALCALKLALRLFPRVSFDLIYARPHQTLHDWEGELREALRYQAGHLSLYQLTIEPGTPYAALQAQGRLTIPPEDLGLDLYTATQDIMTEAGLPAYEISNHARPGHQSHHNLTYWRYGAYAGIGPGAHGRLAFDGNVWALSTEKHPETWRDHVLNQGVGFVEQEMLSAKTQALEQMIMGLRLEEGIDHSVITCAEVSLERLKDLVSDGFLIYREGRVTTTAKGRCVLNALLAALTNPPACGTPDQRIPL